MSSPSVATFPPVSRLDVPSHDDDAVVLRVIKRSGVVCDWDPGKISAAIARAFLAVEGPSATGSARASR